MGISLDVQPGDSFALSDPNGAGKPTTIGIICSLLRKTSGAGEVFGIDTDTHFSQAKMNIGVVPQEFNFSMFEKVLDIITQQGGYYGMPVKLAREPAREYARQLGLWDTRKTPGRESFGG